MTGWRSIRSAVDLISGKWVIAVLAVLADGPRQHTAIQREIHAVSPKVLSETLRRMTTAGLITRVVLSGELAASGYPQLRPVVTGYALTPAGRSLLPPISTLGLWLDAHRHDLTVPTTSNVD